jgi:hypothetical protein
LKIDDSARPRHDFLELQREQLTIQREQMEIAKQLRQPP